MTDAGPVDLFKQLMIDMDETKAKFIKIMKKQQLNNFLNDRLEAC